MEYNTENLDDNWIQQFENTDKLYKDFYKDDLYYITLHIIYVNIHSEIDKIKQESFLMTKPNYITQEEILGILKKNSIDNDKRYSLLSILRYNMNLDSEDVPHYLAENDNSAEQIRNSTNYLSVIKHIDTIKFERSINMFHDLNELILIFYEKSEDVKQTSKNNLTRKIYLRKHSSGKKTIRKQYKDIKPLYNSL